MTILLAAVTEWACPNCPVRDVTREARPHTRFHTCSGLYGMTAPLLPLGTKAKVEVVERQDYIGQDIVQVDSRGRPVMAVKTTRDEGQDVIVFAPTAVARA